MIGVTLKISASDDERDVFEYQLEEGSTTSVGRTDPATIVISDAGLSRRHVTLRHEGDQVWLADENSTNGTFLNDEQISPSGASLQDGDVISIGNHTTIIVEMRRTSRRAPTSRDNAPRRTTPSIAQMPPPAPAPRSASFDNRAATPQPNKSQATAPTITTPIIIALCAGLVIVCATIIGVVAYAVRNTDDNHSTASGGQNANEEYDDEYSDDEYVDEYEDQTEEDETLYVPETPAAPPTKTTNTANTKSSSANKPATTSNSESTAASEAALAAQFSRAITKLKEDRREPTGQAASVEIPAELKHYPDRRRFLSIQTAAAREQNVQPPHDFAELATLYNEKQFVELKPVTDSYVLYGVGAGRTDDFTHYERAAGQSLPMYRTAAELQTGLAAIADDARKSFIQSFYKDASVFKLMSSELESISNLARDFNGRRFDLNLPAERREFKRRLLSLTRPATRKLIEELSLTYKKEFDRPLPIASLIRTDQYQRELSERNVNAAKNSLPPHTTGFAFDVSYRFMNAREQNFLMREIARLENAGRIEALRESNNCFHIFVFAEGRPPAESLVKKVTG